LAIKHKFTRELILK